jgi:thiol:disulfide interchange protein
MKKLKNAFTAAVNNGKVIWPSFVVEFVLLFLTTIVWLIKPHYFEVVSEYIIRSLWACLGIAVVFLILSFGYFEKEGQNRKDDTVVNISLFFLCVFLGWILIPMTILYFFAPPKQNTALT